MKLNRLLQIATSLVVVFAFVGCDEDFTEIGGEIINNPTDVELREFEVNAYSEKINSIQTNNLSSYFLGVNNHPVYGENTASIITQLNLGSDDPEFGDNAVLDSVVLSLPLFSTEETSEDGETIEYELDSIYGQGSFKLSIYETNYFLNTLDPDSDFEGLQKYYSDQQPQIEQNIIGQPLFQEENFQFSREAYVHYEINEDDENDTITYAPALRVKLPVEYFQEKIIAQEGSDVLLNNANFQDYFRSLFIKAEQNGGEGEQALLNFASENSRITLYYNYETQEEDDEGNETTVSKRGSFNLNIAGANRFNTYTGEFPQSVLDNIAGQSSETGSENLFLKTQEGSMAIVDLFPDETVLDELRENNWLINEASLTFYVNQDELNGAAEPERLYVYDIENNTLLLDYQLDPTANDARPLASRTVFSAPLERDEDENGVFYKIRITQHLTAVLNEDIENVKLGVVITSNINLPNFSAVRNMENVERVPAASLTNPYGTVLHGDESSSEDKRLKLRIYYTDY